MTSAESQGYRPRYGLNSGHNVPFLEQNVPAAQLRGALGVGWTGPGTVVRTPPNARGKLCDDVLRKAGNPKPSSPVAAGIQSIYCGLFLFLQQVLAKPVDVTPPGFKAGAQQLGTSYWHPGAFAVRLTPARYQTGAAAVRPFAFDDSCECFHWTGPQRPYP